jgi:hypothetical protein
MSTLWLTAKHMQIIVQTSPAAAAMTLQVSLLLV